MQKEFALWECIGYLLLHNKLPQHLAALTATIFELTILQASNLGQAPQIVILISVDIAHLSTVSCWQVSLRVGWPKMTSLTVQQDGSLLGLDNGGHLEFPSLLHPVGQARLIHMEIQRVQDERKESMPRSPEAQTEELAGCCFCSILLAKSNRQCEETNRIS